MIIENNPFSAITAIHQGHIVAYPTEAVYGLGCDPRNQTAVANLLALKKRPFEKGLILIAASWEQLKPLVAPIPESALKRVLHTWPGPNTWVFPASEETPPWICGRHGSVAVRVTAHKLANALCQAVGHPIVSTSANVTGHPPALNAAEVQLQFPEGIEVILAGELGGQNKPTQICDALTGAAIRAA